MRLELPGPREEETSYLHMAEVEVFAAGDCSRPPADPLMVMAVKDGSPAPMRILVRGNHHNPGKLVPRRFLQILDRGQGSVVNSEQSGRLELARFIARPDNPLTARVMVNRIWQWHFGRGPSGQQRQLREPGGQAVPSRAAGSIGRPFHGFGMVRQAVAPADPALQPLPDAERRLQPGG